MRSVMPISVILVFALLPDAVQARDLIFGKSKIVVVDRDGKTRQKKKKAIVAWGDSTVSLRFKDGDDSVRYREYEGIIRYDSMSDLTYSHTKHWRVASAILLSPLTLFSRRKHHWFSWNYVDDAGKKHAVILRIDKREEKLYRRHVPLLTGLELEIEMEN